MINAGEKLSAVTRNLPLTETIVPDEIDQQMVSKSGLGTLQSNKADLG
jgi:hypothetical protein